MSLIVELLALAEGLYVLIGAVIVLGGLALFAVELLQHLCDEEARMKRMSAANVYVNHVHIHVSSPPENGDGRDTQRRRYVSLSLLLRPSLMEFSMTLPRLSFIAAKMKRPDAEVAVRSQVALIVLPPPSRARTSALT
jgi:hypothetical protein